MSLNTSTQTPRTSQSNQGSSAMAGFQALEGVKKLSRGFDEIINQDLAPRVKVSEQKIETNRKVNLLQGNKITKNIENLDKLNKKMESVNKQTSKYSQEDWDKWSERTDDILKNHAEKIIANENGFTQVARDLNDKQTNIDSNSSEIFKNTQNMEKYNTNHLKNNTKTNENINEIKSNLIILSNSLKTDYLLDKNSHQIIN